MDGKRFSPMIYFIVHSLLASGWLKGHHLKFLGVFLSPEFQAPAAVVVSFAICMLAGEPLIRWLRRQKIGDINQSDIHADNQAKQGTPTMGGVLIIAAIVATTVLLANLENFYVLMALVCVVWLGGVGAADDWLKLTVGRRAGSRQGLTSLEKFLFQLALGVVLSIFTYRYGSQLEPATQLYFPFFKNASLHLSLVAFVLIGTLVMTGSSNAVNLTDGLDGLASGCMAIASFTFLVFALIVGNHQVASFLLIPEVEPAGQMAVLAGAMAGACLGFLWFNCNPARVFMGDTGSLSMGGLIGYIAIVIRHELVLVFVGGIFVAEAVSVMMQVGYFKYTRRKFGQGRRIFLMAPLHHHFQKKGWSENQVVVRFWLISFMLAAMALATIKLR
jgi:phospho-N-acetylmuramoyl-pentapeptide-transferase